jgi:hypothetical protein
MGLGNSSGPETCTVRAENGSPLILKIISHAGKLRDDTLGISSIARMSSPAFEANHS